MLEIAIRLSKGNPGALTCVVELLKEHPMPALTILPKVEELNIVGTDLYVFWSDLCNKDYELMVQLCHNCPDNILKDACSRQDYSGRELVKPYFYGS